jgi:hypothetical protein
MALIGGREGDGIGLLSSEEATNARDWDWECSCHIVRRAVGQDWHENGGRNRR